MNPNDSQRPDWRGFPRQGLYDPQQEHDSCGVGFLVHLDGRPSHELVTQSVAVLQNLLHRGAVGGDGRTGDGAGLLMQIPDAFLRREAQRQGVALPPSGRYGVGMVFLPREPGLAESARRLIERLAQALPLDFLGWRSVPVDSALLGDQARASCPVIAQFWVAGSFGDAVEFERRLYLLRKRITRAAEAEGIPLYLPSLSCRTLVYKGLLMGAQVSGFYRDLADPECASALAVVHQRYSTNTFPSWELSQPFRLLAHNGEINTLRGNLNQMRARERGLESPFFGDEMRDLLPIIDPGGSDSACLDNALEMLTACGRSLPHAMMMLIPEAWGVKYPMGPDQRGFFEYHAGLMEPWDGPATVAFTDGERVGAMLDRNGLRPARYCITRANLMVMASEAGVLPLASSEIREKGSLRPGQMILVDLAERRILRDDVIKTRLARRQPYRRWVEENKITLQGFFGAVAPVHPDEATLADRQRMFGYTREDVQTVLAPMAATAHEPVGSMGHDLPLAVFSEKPQLLFNYFKQLFAQVTNPPIDPIREELVMSLMTFIGNPPNILQETPANARLIKLRHPILSNEDLGQIQALTLKDFAAANLSFHYDPETGEAGLESALSDLADRAAAAVQAGRNLVVLSDREIPSGRMPIPSLLAVSAVNRRLVAEGLRTRAGVIVSTGEVREVMHLALLLGYGATAVNPYLAFETVASLALRRELEPDPGVAKALENYITALCEGLRKIMSKMGISTLRSYRGAEVFEAVGLNHALLDAYFPGTASRVEGIGLREIAEECRMRAAAARAVSGGGAAALPGGGVYRYRQDGERHLWTPFTLSTLQRATRENDAALFKQYSQRIDEQSEKIFTLRGLFRFQSAAPVPLEEVEPVESICRRFVTGAMSFGSISREAHETIAIAMNRLGAMSNSGEGGEDPARYAPLSNGDSRCSAIKQVASGRFGVTAEYGVNCRELQIKIAQGAKPGEGGQLPGHKVNAEIARVRHSTPGVTLISPPPHHDIYSIEDIKQLIYDLKNLNPRARISVKLVSELGVGTIAAGVAKANAEMILISGYDGGTGASPLSSIRHAGVPWELGLAETQQTLVLNNLRGRVRLQTDGQLKTGRDVVIAALLGAEEFGFATTALVVCGCVMMRKCHLNTCPVGVATQDPALRRFFSGKPEYLVNFFRFIAQEVREHLARLGLRSIDEAVGRSDLLNVDPAIRFWKARGLDFQRILARPAASADTPVRCAQRQTFDLDQTLDARLLPRLADALDHRRAVTVDAPIANVDRSVGTRISGEVARRYGHEGLPDDTITCRFRGSAGQSFGAWCARGVTLILEGEANDYVGKGLSGGRIAIRPPAEVAFDPAQNTIAGNVILYGATGGEVYIGGLVGERFAVRNSGGQAVVEGVGDHACEYMTGGRVVILGRTGLNFAAGMSGGIAYVYDEDRRFDSRCNLDMVDLELLEDPQDLAEVRRMLARHVHYTGSRKAERILDEWPEAAAFFVKVFPMEYRRVLGRMTREDEATERQEVVHG